MLRIGKEKVKNALRCAQNTRIAHVLRESWGFVKRVKSVGAES